MEGDKAKDFAERTIQHNNKLAGGFDQQPLKIADRLLTQTGGCRFQFVSSPRSPCREQKFRSVALLLGC